MCRCSGEFKFRNLLALRVNWNKNQKQIGMCFKKLFFNRLTIQKLKKQLELKCEENLEDMPKEVIV